MIINDITKSNMNEQLDKIIDNFPLEIKFILENSDFDSKQRQDLEDICRQVFYCINDLKDAIKLLNK